MPCRAVRVVPTSQADATQQGKEKQKDPKGKLLSTDGIDISELDVPDKFKKGNADLKSLRCVSLRSFSSASLFLFFSFIC